MSKANNFITYILIFFLEIFVCYTDLEEYIGCARSIADDWQIEHNIHRPILGVRFWPRITESGLKAKFPGSEIKVAEQRLVLMTPSEKNVPLFEYLLKEGLLF